MDRFQLRVVAGLNNLEMARASFARHRFPLHFHDTWVIQVVDYGSDQFECMGRRYLARPGDVVIIPPGSIHSGEPASDRLEYRVIYPGPDFMARSSADLPTLGQGVFAADRRLLTRFNRTFELLGGSSLNRIKRSFCDLIRSLSDYAGLPAESPTSRSHVTKVLDRIHQGFAQSLHLDDLADGCGMSPFQLIRAFRRQVGMTPHQYIINYRVLAAKRLLATTQRDLSRVALDSGFADQSHMNRRFRKYFGVTPGQYRQECRSNLPN